MGKALDLDYKYLTDQKFGKAFGIYMRVLAVAAFGWLVIQGVYILTNDTSEGFSIAGLGAYMAALASWLGYGVLRNDVVLKTSGTVGIFANIFVLTCIFIVNKEVW